MQTIYKYPIELNDDQYIAMPKDAEILTVQIQNGELFIWALVDPDAVNTNRHIEVFGTGHPVSDHERQYVGTFQMSGGALVFHVFQSQH